jgi:hypothetical protein
MLLKERVSECPMAEIDKVSERILKFIRKKLRKKYGSQKPLKAVHTKTIGLVTAKFKVEALKEDLREGLFKEAKTYDAWIRFSNGSSTPSPDAQKDLRGMAIKVLNIDGTEFLDSDSEGKTQDIIMFTSSVTIPAAPEDQLSVPELALGNPFERLWAIITALSSLTIRSVRTFLEGVKKTPNVLEERYYSATPYAYGRHKAIKWQAIRNKTIVSVLPENPVENFLRERLIMDLSQEAKEDISFDLLVQFQENEQTEPIEDPGVEWKTEPHLVATITIPRQNLNTPERAQKDSQISFSPGHAIIEHAPLGGVNMIRRKVYETLARERSLHTSL